MASARVGVSRDTARGVLKKYGIKAPPTDVSYIAAQEGLLVKLIPTWPNQVSGLLLRDECIVGINGNHSPRRQRFSLAHELGHWFLRHDMPWHDEEVTIDNPPQLADRKNHPSEDEANEFAGELLVPLAQLKPALREAADRPAALADVFDVSEQALWVRILRHRLL